MRVKIIGIFCHVSIASGPLSVCICYMFLDYNIQVPLLNICCPCLGIMVSCCFVMCLSLCYPVRSAQYQQARLTGYWGQVSLPLVKYRVIRCCPSESNKVL